VVNAGKQILVPLTASLYVPGTLKDADNVIVDVGTGFYVEKVGNEYILNRVNAY
jgi:prefoldin alpha subunit